MMKSLKILMRDKVNMVRGIKLNQAVTNMWWTAMERLVKSKISRGEDKRMVWPIIINLKICLMILTCLVRLANQLMKRNDWSKTTCFTRLSRKLGRVNERLWPSKMDPSLEAFRLFATSRRSCSRFHYLLPIWSQLCTLSWLWTVLVREISLKLI